MEVPHRLSRLVRGTLNIASTLIVFSTMLTASAQDVRDRDAGSAAPPATAGADARYMPPGTQQPAGKYKLGIYSRNTDTGVVINQVQPGSAAAQAGLEANDVIVNIAGYQVGMVGGRIYDVGEELAKRVDGRGQVSMLVRNSRNGSLLNLPVKFTSNRWSIAGEVGTRDRVNLSPTALLTVRLLDVTNAQWSDVAIAEANLGSPRVWPVTYRLDFDSSLLRPGHRYGVDARVIDRGQVVMRTPSASLVALAATGTRANLQLVSATVPPTNTTQTPSNLISQWYQQYLGRLPTPREISAWEYELQRGRSLADVQAGLLSSSEFYDRQRNDPNQFVDAVYSQLYRAQPTPEIHRAMMVELQKRGQVRHQFVQDLIARQGGGVQGR